MTDFFSFLSSTQLKLLLVIFSVSAIFFLTTGSQLLRHIRFSRKICGPSLWEVITVYGIQIMKAQIHTFMTEVTEKYNFKPWGVWAGINYYVFISNAEAMRDAFKSKTLKDKSDRAYCVFEDNLGHNVLSSNKLEWKRRRLLYSSSFKKSFLELHLDIIYEEAEKALVKLEHRSCEEEFDISHLIESTLARAILRSIMSYDAHFDDKELDDALLYVNILFDKSMSTYMKPSFLHVSFLKPNRNDYKRHGEVKAYFYEFFGGIVDMITQRLMGDHNSIAGKPLETILSNNLTKQTLTRDEIVADTMIMFGAGVDTTSTTISVAISLLALHPEVQERAADEVRRELGESDGPINPEDLDRLEYLTRIIKESMRLFPPGIVTMRKAVEDTVLDGTLVPKGANVMFNFFSLHRNPSVFKDPLKFDPDRFLKENQKLQSQYAYLPFSSGNRDCMGKDFAMLTMKIFLSMFLKKYKVFPGRELKSVEDIKCEWSFTLNVRGNFVRLVRLGDRVS